MTESTPIAAYVRISRDPYGTGVSVANQLDAIKTWADQHGYEIAETFQDNDMSATTGKRRPEFERLLESNWTRAVAWHQDRLLRLPSDLERIIDRNPPLMIFQVQAGPLDLATPSGQMSARIVAAVSAYEGQQKAERQKAAHLGEAKAGRYVGKNRRFGQRRDGSWIDGEAQAVQDAAKRLETGQTSFVRVAREWNEKGLKTARGGFWTKTTVRRYFESPLLIGKQIYRGVEYQLGPQWKPLLEVKTYERIQSLIQRQPNNGAKRVTERYLLSGLLRCSVCESRLTSRPGKYPQYQCPNPTAHVTIIRAQTEEAVTNTALTLLSRRDKLDRKIQEIHEQVAELSHKIRLEESAFEAWVDDALEGDVPASLIAKKQAIHSDRIAVMKADLATLHANSSAEMFTENGTGWDDSSSTAKRNLLESVFEYITVKPTKLKRFTEDRLEYHYTPFALEMMDRYIIDNTVTPEELIGRTVGPDVPRKSTPGNSNPDDPWETSET